MATTTKALGNGQTVQAVGTVKNLAGTVTAIDANGVERELHLGDLVFAGDVIHTSADGAVTIDFPNGAHLDLGRSDSLALDGDVLNVATTEANADDVAKIQQLIAQGLDPTQVAEATAAGAGTGEDGGSTFVDIGFNPTRVDIPTGVNTEGLTVDLTQAPGTPPFVAPEVPVNQPPVAVNDDGTTNENTPISIPVSDLLSNDHDPENDQLTVVSVQGGQDTHGTVVLQNGVVVFTPDEGYDGPATFQYTITDGNGGTSTATVTIEVAPVADKPDVSLQVVGEDREGGGFLKEDVQGELAFTASPHGDDQISQIVIGGFGTGANAWNVDTSSVTISGLDHSKYDVSMDGSGNLIISIHADALAAGGLSGTVMVTPNADSDVDRVLTVSATAVDGSASATGSSDSTVVVDAVADQPGIHIAVSDGNDGNASFQIGESGTLTVSGNFGDTSDGSETHTVSVAIPDGFTVTAGEGATFVDGVLTFTVSGTSFNQNFTLTNESASDGSASFTATATAQETSLSGSEPDGSDNVATATDSTSVTVAGVPEVSATLVGDEGEGLVIKEDGSGSVSVSADASTGSHLTQLVITGLNAGWTYDFSSLSGTVHYDSGTGTLTISDLSGGSYNGSFTLSPPADSDVDLGTLHVTATGANDTDPSVTSDGGGSLSVVVDAVADQPGIHISVSDGGDGNDSFQIGESGTLTVSGNFGDATDGSETHTVSVAIPDGFTVTAGEGATFVDGVLTFTVSGTSFNQNFTLTNESASDGSASFTATATAQETSLSGAEPDSGDNLATATDSTSVTVADVPQVNAALVGGEGEGLVIKEDGSGSVSVTADASTGSHLTQLVITGLDGGWTYDFSGLSGTVNYNAGTGTLTISGLSGGSYSGSFTLYPPADSDVDLGTLHVTATGANDADPSVTSDGSGSLGVGVDAVLDQYGDVSGTTQTHDESASVQSYNLGMSLSVSDAGFTGSMAGGADTDGSESISASLMLNSALPAGVTLSLSDSALGSIVDNGDHVNFTFTVNAGHTLSEVVAAVQVTVPAGYDGTISGTLSSHAADTPTDSEFATGDNTRDDSASFSVTVNAGAGEPTLQVAGLTEEGNSLQVKEDSNGSFSVTVDAADATDQITVVHFGNLPPAGWGFSVTGLDGGTFNALTGDYTVNGVMQHVALTVTVTPPADSDADWSGITVQATAADITSPSTMASSGTSSVNVVVDAVLDQYADVSASALSPVSEQVGAHAYDLGLSLSMASAGFTGSMAGGADTDGSEQITSITLMVSAGTLQLGSSYGGAAVLTDDGGGHYTLSGFSSLADLQSAVSSVQVVVAGGMDGTITGSISTTTAESAVVGTGEYDGSDNTKSDTATFSLVVNDSTPSGATSDSFSVDEDDLPKGTDTSKESLVVTGTVIDNATWGVDGFGGVDKVTFNGTDYFASGGHILITGPASAWTLDVNAATGDYTFTLLSNLTVTGAGENVVALPAFTVVATDGDGDSINIALNASVVDDVPQLAVTDAHALNTVGVDFTGHLANVGADQPATTDISLGANFPSLTSVGVPLVYVDSGGTITAYAGSVSDANLVFTVSANTDGTYTFHEYRALDLSVLNSDLQSSVGAGGPQPSYYMYQDGTFSSVSNLSGHGGWQVQISSPGNVNPSQQGMGVGNNHLSSGEVLNFNVDNEGASGTADHIYAVKLQVADFSSSSEQMQFTMHFTDGSTVTSTNALADGYMSQDASGNWFLTLHGTSSQLLDSFTVSTTGDVRIAGYSSYSLDNSQPKDLPFNFTVTDSDGDAVSGTVHVTLVNGTSYIDDAGNHVVAGGSGAESLDGGLGNDILVGGGGNDILTGGGGVDTFQFSSAATNGMDTIVDFVKGAGGDVLDITSLLTGAGISETAFNSSPGAYLQFVSDGSGGTLVKFDADGGGSGSAVTVATLQGVDPTNLMNTLLANGEIQTHH